MPSILYNNNFTIQSRILKSSERVQNHPFLFTPGVRLTLIDQFTNTVQYSTRIFCSIRQRYFWYTNYYRSTVEFSLQSGLDVYKNDYYNYYNLMVLKVILRFSSARGFMRACQLPSLARWRRRCNFIWTATITN